MAGPPRPAIRGITFDYWDTLVAGSQGTGSSMRRLQIDRFAATLGEAGHVVAEPDLAAAFDENWDRFEERWIANTGQYTPADTVGFVAARVGVPLTPVLRTSLIDGFGEVGRHIELELAPGVAGTLEVLRRAGVRIGIVCDVGLTPSPVLRERLDGFGVAGAFDAMAFSDETGWFKPAAEAFRPALEGMGMDDPAEVAHVGDNPRTDVAGARSLGMTAVRYVGFRDATRQGDTTGEGTDRSDRASDDPDPPAPPSQPAHHVIDDHRALPALLGVG